MQIACLKVVIFTGVRKRVAFRPPVAHYFKSLFPLSTRPPVGPGAACGLVAPVNGLVIHPRRQSLECLTRGTLGRMPQRGINQGDKTE